MGNKYMKRIADRILQERLAASGAVLIEGPKWKCFLESIV